jgi:hypothetical protein
LPLVRKIVSNGSSRGVNLPASWIAFIEKESGQPLKEIVMDVCGNVITIRPAKKGDSR